MTAYLILPAVAPMGADDANRNTQRRMTVNTRDRRTYGGTPAEIVRQMRDEAWIAEDSKDGYMQAVAARVRLQTGAEIRTDTPTHFVDDLAAAGLIDIAEAQ